jgi:sialate O-acetylesterase
MKKIITTVCAVTAMSVWAKIEMGAPFVDGVILQRDRAVPVWGNADAGKKVTVQFAGNSASAIAGQDGKWMVKLPAMKASKESRVMTVVAGDEKLSINDVLVGEVWMCAGQSNTECPVWGINPRYRDGQGATVILMVNKPHVRFVNVPRAAAVSPVNNLKTKWVKMTPELFKDCEKRVELPSAMGYYFALELVNALDIPIAVVDASWGGTNIDAWTPRSGYDGMDSLKDVASLPVLNEKDFGVSRKEGVYKGKGVYGGWAQQPTALWNAMVAAYTPMACRGLIWYQGCHNSR